MTTNTTKTTTFDTTINNIGGTRGIGLRAFCAHYDETAQARVAAMLETGAFTNVAQAIAFHDWYISSNAEMSKKLSAETLAKLSAATPHGKGARAPRTAKTDEVAALKAQLEALTGAIQAGAFTPARDPVKK